MGQSDSVSVHSIKSLEIQKKKREIQEIDSIGWSLSREHCVNCHLTAGVATSILHTVPRSVLPSLQAETLTQGFNRKLGSKEIKQFLTLHKCTNSQGWTCENVSALSVMAKTETSQMAITR